MRTIIRRRDRLRRRDLGDLRHRPDGVPQASLDSIRLLRSAGIAPVGVGTSPGAGNGQVPRRHRWRARHDSGGPGGSFAGYLKETLAAELRGPAFSLPAPTEQSRAGLPIANWTPPSVAVRAGWRRVLSFAGREWWCMTGSLPWRRPGILRLSVPSPSPRRSTNSPPSSASSC